MAEPSSRRERAALGLENPFFRREIRGLSRRALPPIQVPLIGIALLFPFGVFLLEGLLWRSLGNGIERRILALAVLVLIHVGACAAAGGVLGQRVLADEARQHTLEGLHLLPVRSHRWLLPKLVFPLYGLAVVWLGALPFWIVLVLRLRVTLRELTPVLLIAGAAGLTALAAALMAPAAGVRAEKRGRSSLAASWEDLGHAALPGWVGLALLRLLWDWLFWLPAQAGPYFRPVSCFWFRLDSGAQLGVLLGALWLAALGTALHAADPASSRTAMLRAAGRTLGFATAYYLVVGMFWAGKPPLVQGLMAVAFPVLVVVPRLGRRSGVWRFEDRTAAAEIELVRRVLGENPVLIRDLRTSLRRVGLRRQQALYLLFWILVLAGTAGMTLLPGMFFIRLSGDQPFVLEFLTRMAGAGMVYSLLSGAPVLLMIGARALLQWRAEQRAHTLGQLFDSPLSTADIVTGRLVAALLSGSSRALPVVILFGVSAAVTGWAQSSGNTIGILLTMGFWMASLGMVLAAGFAGAARDSRRPRLSDLGTASSLAAYLFLCETVVFPVAIAFGVQNIGTEGTVAYAIAMTLGNVIATGLIYSKSVADVDALRSEDS